MVIREPDIETPSGEASDAAPHVVEDAFEGHCCTPFPFFQGSVSVFSHRSKSGGVPTIRGAEQFSRTLFGEDPCWLSTFSKCSKSSSGNQMCRAALLHLAWVRTILGFLQMFNTRACFRPVDQEVPTDDGDGGWITAGLKKTLVGKLEMSGSVRGIHVRDG